LIKLNEPKDFVRKLLSGEWVKDPFSIAYVCYATKLLMEKKTRRRRRRRRTP